MRYGSVCSGIEAATVAWHGLGWEPAWFSEIERFPCAVLAHHYPKVPNLGDMLAITEETLEKHGRIDLLVGGTPCQSFSIAGLRGGLDDPRGNLALRFCQLASVARPRWFVWENVPGVLSSGAGDDFGSIIRAMEELGYGVAWRSLDAQYFHLAQRRERVFAVGYLGDWRPAAAVLLEPEGLRGDPAPSREAGSVAAGCVTSGIGGGRGGVDDNDARAGHVISHCLNAGGMGRRDYETETFVTHSLTSKGYDASEDGTGRGTPLVPSGHAVRRLTTRECCRLQGFPDDYLDITYRGKPAADGPRYAALGNSMAVPVMRWIGERIQMVDRIKGANMSERDWADEKASEIANDVRRFGSATAHLTSKGVVVNERGPNPGLESLIAAALRTAHKVPEGCVEAARVLAKIADAYDDNGLDDEARKFWGKNDEHHNTTPPEHIELYDGRGGRCLLTLADCLNARAALAARGEGK